MSWRLKGLGEEQRLDVSHPALAPLERLALVITSDPGCEGKSCVRTCTYCFTCCLYVFTYYYTCGILPAFRDIHTSLRAYSWFGPLFRPFAGVPQGRVRYRTEVRVHG